MAIHFHKINKHYTNFQQTMSCLEQVPTVGHLDHDVIIAHHPLKLLPFHLNLSDLSRKIQCCIRTVSKCQSITATTWLT